MTFSPAAADTIYTFLKNMDETPNNFDAIFTGDLGSVGSELLYKLLEERGVNIRSVHKDCGNLIFDPNEQDVHAGGSGCGCSASVLCSYIVKNMHEKRYKRILFCATGALLSPTTTQQGETIPSIAHLLCLEI